MNTHKEDTTVETETQLISRNFRFRKGVHMEVQSAPNHNPELPPFKKVWLQAEGVSVKTSLLLYSPIARFVTKAVVALITYRWHGKAIDETLKHHITS
jgi:hypothetical protein